MNEGKNDKANLEYMENYLNENKAYDFCKDYAPQRQWCKDNVLDMSELADEI